MRKHNGMRPFDIIVLLKIIALDDNPWMNKDLSSKLFISPSEIGESLNRNEIAGLIDYNRKKVNRQGLYEFIRFGLHYVFPQQPSAMTNGIPTAHSHPFFQKQFKSELHYVWPDFKGNVRGLSIEPLYPGQINAAKDDPLLYKLLALLDVFRVGRVREIAFADKELRKIILLEQD